jgi:hypothetical protein
LWRKYLIVALDKLAPVKIGSAQASSIISKSPFLANAGIAEVMADAPSE